jgi:deazaflavin-dependent oxidoreductase (nitroreductase family)
LPGVTADQALASEDYCYLTTTGRRSGEPREIEIWFGLQRNTLYMLSGGGERSNWVKNLQQDPSVSVRIADSTFSGTARLVDDGEEDERARRLLLDKYESRYSGDLGGWGRTALPIAVDLD